MICVLLIVLILGCWALLLMEQAYRRQEFSRMLAGMLVVFAAGGVLTVYFFMQNYIAFWIQQHDLQHASGLLQDLASPLSDSIFEKGSEF